MSSSFEGEHGQQQLAAARQEREEPPKPGIPIKTLDQLIQHLEELVTRREEVTTYPTHDANLPVWHLQRNVQSWWAEADAIHLEALDNLYTLRFAGVEMRVTKLPSGYCPRLWFEVDASIVGSWINTIHKTTETLNRALDGEQVSNFFIRASVPSVDLARLTDWALWETLMVTVGALVEEQSHRQFEELDGAQILQLSGMFNDADDGNLTLSELCEIAARFIKRSEEDSYEPLRSSEEEAGDTISAPSTIPSVDQEASRGEEAWQALSDDFARLDPNPWAD